MSGLKTTRWSAAAVMLTVAVLSAAQADTYHFKDVLRPHGHERSLSAKFADGRSCGASGSRFSGDASTLDVSDAAAAATAKPGASASVTSGGCTSGFPGSGCSGGSYGADAEVLYDVYVSGPAGVEVPFYVDTAGGVTGGNNAGAQAEVTMFSDALGISVFDARSSSSGTCGTTCITSTQHVSLLSDTLYFAEVDAYADASGNNPWSASAWADPYIYIDPAFVGGNQFTLLISRGVGNAPLSAVPEPSTWYS